MSNYRDEEDIKEEDIKKHLNEYEKFSGGKSSNKKLSKSFEFWALSILCLALSVKLNNNIITGLLSIASSVASYKILRTMLDLELCLGPFQVEHTKKDHPFGYALEVIFGVITAAALFLLGVYLLIRT